MTRSLSYQERSNATAAATLIFVHGACSSGSEWDLVTPHLQNNYHILLPDLPHHGASCGIAPFTIDLAVSLLAELIRTHAINSKAHVIGLSLGATVVLALASAHPSLAQTVFVSGYGTFSSMSPDTLARGLWLQSRIEGGIPRSWMRWAMDGTDFPSSPMPSLELCRQIATPHTPGKEGVAALKPWPARTLIIAAGKKDWLPTADSQEDAKAVRDCLIEAQEGKTKAVTHPQLRHPWSRQRPELFADAVRAWVEEARVVDGFNEL